MISVGGPAKVASCERSTPVGHWKESLSMERRWTLLSETDAWQSKEGACFCFLTLASTLARKFDCQEHKRWESRAKLAHGPKAKPCKR